jgi:hypothetical protein
MEVPMAKPIYVIGYPKSGNTWLSRLLGAVLDSPVKAGGKKHALALADGGYNRPGEYVIRQRHMVDFPRDSFAVILLIRDPRDVCVSVEHYWKMKSLSKAIRCVGTGQWPVTHGGGWWPFYDRWTSYGYTASVFYENMHADAGLAVKYLLGHMGIKPVKDVDEAVEHHSFENMRKRIVGSGSKYPYGENIQLQNMRKGVVGDWKKRFEEQHIKQAVRHFNEGLLSLGYEADPEWWREEKWKIQRQ